ncbi:hypothetical protein FRC00_001343 [Tulasnella sp. 408]|nr:hypothetical protein FRC00_001343 [Tulasnella sp. 408]
MIGEKPPRLMPKRKKWSAHTTGGRCNRAEAEQDSVRNKDAKDAKEPVLGGDRKRERATESSSVELSGSSKKKRMKIAPSAEQHPAAVRMTSGGSKNAEATFDHDTTKETRLSDPDSGSLPQDSEVESSHSPLVPMTELRPESSPEPGDEASFQDGTPLSDGVQASPQSTSLDGIETSLATDPNVPHTESWISFGYLECLEDPSICYDLRIQNNGSESLDILIGSDPKCNFMVEGGDGMGRKSNARS